MFLGAFTSQCRNCEDTPELTHWEYGQGSQGRRLIIPAAETETLNKLYYDAVLAPNRRAVSHLVESQLTRGAPPETQGTLAVDIDLKFDAAAYDAHAAAAGWTPRSDAAPHFVHYQRHLMPFVQAQQLELYRLLHLEDAAAAAATTTVRVFVLQKDRPIEKDGAKFSDGVHMFVSAALDMEQHCWMHERMCAWIAAHWLCPRSPHFMPGLGPDADARQILDKNVYAGNNAILKYGSRKPQDTLTYLLTGFFEYSLVRNYRAGCSLLPPAAAPAPDTADPDAADPDAPDEAREDWLDAVFDSADDDGGWAPGDRGGGQFGPWVQAETALPTAARRRAVEQQWLHLMSVRAADSDVVRAPPRPELAAALEAFRGRHGRAFKRRAVDLQDALAIGSGIARKMHLAQLADFAPETLSRIQDRDQLDYCMSELRDSIHPNDEETSLVLQYLFALPEDEYYGHGTYAARLQVGFALRNYSPKLLSAYLCFCAQRADFNFHDKVPKIIRDWQSGGGAGAGVRAARTHRSLQYWCRQSAPADYARICSTRFSTMLEQVLSKLSLAGVGRGVNRSGTDWDKADLLHRMVGCRFCCASVKYNQWYEFRDHRWAKMETVSELRYIVQNDMYDRCYAHVQTLFDRLRGLEGEALKAATAYAQNALNICTSLRDTRPTDNLIKEAAHRFYDPDFLKRLDTDGYKRCYLNGVLDLTDLARPVFREGRQDDYISRRSEYDYVPLDRHSAAARAEYMTYMRSLFPDPAMLEYMLDHVASTFVADASKHQYMHLYTGVGNNGKSSFVDLLILAHGETAVLLNKEFYVSKSGQLGAAGQELHATIGASFVYSYEFTEGAKLYDDLMKSFVAGDIMEARLLYGALTKFRPGASAAVATNHIPLIVSTDVGIWRRVRQAEFTQCLTHTPDPRDPLQSQQMDSDEFKAMMQRIYPVVISEAVERLKVTRGLTELRGPVKVSSELLRREQDVVAAFIADTVEPKAGGFVTQKELKKMLCSWCRDELGDFELGGKKGAELTKRMGDKFKTTKGKIKGWHNVAIIAAAFPGEQPGAGGGDAFADTQEAEEQEEEEEEARNRKRARDEEEEEEEIDEEEEIFGARARKRLKK